MSEEVDTVSITILGREYQISCPPAEEEALRKSAKYLDKQMAMVKSRGSTLAYEKVAVMAALNICHELMQQSQQANDSESSSLDKIKTLEEKIDLALQSSRQIEICLSYTSQHPVDCPDQPATSLHSHLIPINMLPNTVGRKWPKGPSQA